ncbi:MAG: methyltransferase domain-containing protein [Nitrospirae bacterium]|nr:methyltransferase domain-containing protein [Nitrospirota bacterium]
MSDLEFTGERVIPGKVEKDLYQDHLARYLFAARCVKGKRVLDFGCGAGYGAEVLRKAGASKVTGIDISPEAVAYARSNYAGNGIEFVIGDCRNAPFPARGFDVVVSFEVLEHIEDQTSYLSEVRRLLTPEGIFIVSTPNKKTYTDERQVPKSLFHRKEFYLDDLRAFLEKQFPFVEIYGQCRTEGVLIKRQAREDKGLRNLKDLNGDVQIAQDAEGSGFPESSQYFIAVCGEGLSIAALPKDSFFFLGEGDAVRKLVTWARKLEEEVGKSKEHFASLRKEFEERTGWAMRLNEEVKKKDERILALQRELEEKSKWAERLDAEIKKLREKAEGKRE